MTTIGVRELRQNASKYLAQVEAGEEVRITNHGRLVARLVPVSSDDRSHETLISVGVLTPARNPRRLATLPLRPPDIGEQSLSVILDEMRNEQ